VNERIPYGRQSVDEWDIAAVERVLRSDWLTQGPLVEEFENALAHRVGARFAVAVSSGTAALHLACLAGGIGLGDEVLTSPMTFVASANCALYCGGTPRFSDIEPDTANLDPNGLEDAISPKTRAIIPVHYAGHPCDMTAIGRIAQSRGLLVIEDACHALGAEYLSAPVGCCKYSDMAVFSFHPVKHITTGEGGAIITNDSEIYQRLRELRTHGIVKERARFRSFDQGVSGDWYYEMQELGYNYRITDIQCALGLSQLGRLDEFLMRRRSIAAAYGELLADMPGLRLPVEKDYARSAWHLYPVLLTDAIHRKRVFERLKAQGIDVQVHYIPVHFQPYYVDLFGYRPGDFPMAEAHYANVISLPMFPAMTDEQVERVAATLRTVL